jgi:hypothetical protein
MREYHRRHIADIKLRVGLAAKQPIHQQSGGRNRDGSQRQLAGDIANRVNPFHRCRLPRIHLDMSKRIGRDAELIQKQVIGVRLAAGGEQH